MFEQNFTILPQSHFELIQLGIIAYIFCKTMNYMIVSLPNVYTYAQKGILQIFSNFLHFIHRMIILLQIC